MDNLSHGQITGIDVSRDWLDIHSLPSNQRLRLPNTAEGHGRLSEMALSQSALVCFEATGGQEWKLWAALDAAGVATRQLPPAQIKAFAASRGTRAKTDRIDAELIACFMEFRPDAGRTLPHEKIRLLRALVSKRGQLVETRKRLAVPFFLGLGSPLRKYPSKFHIPPHLALLTETLSRCSDSS